MLSLFAVADRHRMHSLRGWADAEGRNGARIDRVKVAIRDGHGDLEEGAIPRVSIVEDCSYCEDDHLGDPALEVDVIALMEDKLRRSPASCCRG